MSNVIPFNRKTEPMLDRNKIQRILDQLNAEVEFKKDFIIHPYDIRMNKSGFLVSRDRILTHDLTDWALGQLAGKSGIPVKYLRKCPPELRAVNVNHWLQKFDKENHNPWLIRTFTGNDTGLIRGIMSEKYSPFDDHEIMDILNTFFKDLKNDVDVKWWYRDDRGFHLRIVFDDLTTEVGKLDDGQPDIHKVGIHVENSEVGAKSIRITPLIWRQICSNGMMGWAVNGELFAQRHIFLKPHEMYARVAEAIGNALKVGDAAIEKLLQAKETPVENPLEVIKKLAEKNKYSKELTEKIQGAFLLEEGNTAFHVVQAFTRACQNLSAESRVEIESDASVMLDSLLKKKIS